MSSLNTPYFQSPQGYFGEIAQGADGQLYQLTQAVDGLGQVGLAWAPLNGINGIAEAYTDQPQLGEVRLGADGQAYQYSPVVDGLGNLGFAWLPLIAQAIPAVANIVSGLFKGGSKPGAAGGSPLAQLLPQLAQAVAGILSKAGGVSGFGEEAEQYPGTTCFGEESDEPLGLTEDEPGLGNYYLGADGGVYGFEGLDDDPTDELRGLDANPDECLSYAEEDPVAGMAGYMQETGGRPHAYVPQPPAANPPFTPSPTPPPLWQPLW